MKKKIVTRFMVGLAFLFVTSCDKDDTDDIKANMSLSIHGLNYTVEEGVMWRADNNAGKNNVEYIFNDTYVNELGETVTDEIEGFTVEGGVSSTGNFIVSIYEEGMKYDLARNNTYGTGAMITIHFASADLSSLEEGVYTYDRSRLANTFLAYSSTEYNLNSSNTLDVALPNIINQGSIEVKKDGDNYEIDIDCKASTGSEIIGLFKGPLATVDIRKDESIVYIEDVKMDAAFDTLKHSIDYYGWFEAFVEADDNYPNSAFNVSKGKAMNMKSTQDLNDIDKGNIDLALCYDKATNSVFFESPIRMRAKMWHGMYKGIDYLLPCHTKIANAASNMSASDFDAIESVDDFDFTVEEDNGRIAIDAELPKIVTFETGNGLKGAIKITKITPEDLFYINDGGFIIDRPINPKIEFEIKTPLSPSSIKLK